MTLFVRRAGVPVWDKPSDQGYFSVTLTEIGPYTSVSDAD